MSNSYKNISEFKAKVKGVQRSSLFLVEIPSTSFPSSAVVATLDNEYIKYTCKAASVPGSSIGVIEVPYMGRKIKYPGDRQYNEWQTTFIIDTDWKIYQLLYDWQAYYNGPNSARAYKDKYHNNFKGTLKITPYNIMGEPALNKAFYLYGAFPTEINDVDMDWDNTDQASELQITWAYDYINVANSSSSSATADLWDSTPTGKENTN